MATIRVRPEAEADLRTAFAGYEERRPGLGREFLDAIGDTLARVATLPRQFPIVHQDVHRALSKRFPFAVFFVLELDVAVVLAILPQAAHPARWKRRRRARRRGGRR